MRLPALTHLDAADSWCLSPVKKEMDLRSRDAES
jgi:hypothetical protein